MFRKRGKKKERVLSTRPSEAITVPHEEPTPTPTPAPTPTSIPMTIEPKTKTEEDTHKHKRKRKRHTSRHARHRSRSHRHSHSSRMKANPSLVGRETRAGPVASTARYSAQDLALLAAETQLQGGHPSGHEEDDDDEENEARIEAAKTARRRARMAQQEEATQDIAVREYGARGSRMGEMGEGEGEEARYLDEVQYKREFHFGDPMKNEARERASAKPARGTEVDMDLETEMEFVRKGTSQSSYATAMSNAAPSVSAVLLLEDPVESIVPEIGAELERIAGVVQGLVDAADAAQERARGAKAELVTAQDSLAVLLQNMDQLSTQMAFIGQIREYVAELGDCLSVQVTRLEAAEAKAVSSAREANVAALESTATLFLDRVYAVSGQDVPQAYPLTLDREGVTDSESRLVRLQHLSSKPLPPDPWLTDDEDKGEGEGEDATGNGGRRAPFEGVIDEFGLLSHVLGVFGKWKTEHPESYAETFADLALEIVVGPYVRAELVRWDVVKGQELESLPCIEAVFDVSPHLFSRTMANYVIPALCSRLQTSWFLLFSSMRANRALQDAVGLLIELFENDMSALDPLFSALRSAIRLCSQSWACPLPPLDVPDPRAPGYPQLIDHYLQCAFKVLRTTTSWHAFLPPSGSSFIQQDLVSLTQSDFLDARLLPYVRNLAAISPQQSASRTSELYDILPTCFPRQPQP